MNPEYIMSVLSIVLLVAVLVVSILNLTKKCKTSTTEGFHETPPKGVLGADGKACNSCCNAMGACMARASTCDELSAQCEKDKQAYGCSDNCEDMA